MTLSGLTKRLVKAYAANLPADFHPRAPMFLTRRGAAYRENSLSEDLSNVQAMVLPSDTRQLQDMRRTGAVEAQAAGADLSVISQKMANTVLASAQLQKTYLPVNPAAVELADEARKRGRRRILENKAGANVETFRPGELKLNTKGDAK